MEARRMSSMIEKTSQDGRFDWLHDVDIGQLISTMNAVALGYQLAIDRVFGRRFYGLTQLLIHDIGDLIREMVDPGEGSIKERLNAAFKKSGIAREVEVTETHDGDRLRINVVIRRSLFSPLYQVLLRMGRREFPLSPEAMLVAAIVSEAIRKGGGSGRVNMRAEILDEDTLQVTVEKTTGSNGVAAAKK